MPLPIAWLRDPLDLLLSEIEASVQRLFELKEFVDRAPRPLLAAEQGHIRNIAENAAFGQF